MLMEFIITFFRRIKFCFHPFFTSSLLFFRELKLVSTFVFMSENKWRFFETYFIQLFSLNPKSNYEYEPHLNFMSLIRSYSLLNFNHHVQSIKI